MSFEYAESVYAVAEKAFEKVLLDEIERLAKRVIETSDKAKSFCMAMGSASFHCVWRETGWDFPEDPEDYWDCEDHQDPYELHDNVHAVALNALLDKYNERFRLTGCPMKIDRDNVTGELVTVGDW